MKVEGEGELIAARMREHKLHIALQDVVGSVHILAPLVCYQELSLAAVVDDVLVKEIYEL